MSIRTALVDRGHTWEIVQGATDAYGEASTTDSFGPTFRCRASKPDPVEIRNDKIEFTQYGRDLDLLVGMKAENGTLVEIEANDRIVIEGGVYAGTYDVVGDPTPIRKKRTQIGWTAMLKESTGKAP